MQKTENTIPLTEVPTDMNVTVCCLDDKYGIRSRLCALGITPGSKLTICGATRCVLVKGAPLQLCQTMQECIHCKPCCSEACHNETILNDECHSCRKK